MSVGGRVSQVERWAPLAAQAGRQYGVQPSVILGLIQVESDGNPNLTSSAGACGLTQFIPSTARQYGVKCGGSASATRSQIFGAARYLKELGYSKNPRNALGRYYGSTSSPYAGNVLRNAKNYSKYDSAAFDAGIPGIYDPFDLLEGELPTPDKVLDTVTEPLQKLATLVGVVFTAKFWLRVGKVMLGVIALVVGGYAIVKAFGKSDVGKPARGVGKSVKSAANTVSNVVPQGKALKVAGKATKVGKAKGAVSGAAKSGKSATGSAARNAAKTGKSAAVSGGSESAKAAGKGLGGAVEAGKAGVKTA